MKHFITILFLCFYCIAFSQEHSLNQGSEIRLKIGLPYINSFTLHPASESRKNQTGWVGLEGGLEFQWNNNYFIGLEYSINGAAEALGLLDIAGEFDRFITQSINLSYNYKVNRFTFGGGLSYAQNNWIYTRTFIPEDVPPSRGLVDRRSKNIGLIFNSYYGFGKSFNIGLIYRPYLFKLNGSRAVDYEHVISLDIMWRIRIFKFR